MIKTPPHTVFDELHTELLALLDKIDNAELVDGEGYVHETIDNTIHDLTRQRFTIMESHGYNVAEIGPGSGVTH